MTNEERYAKALVTESKMWGLTILPKYSNGPMKYLMRDEEQARAVFTELTELVAKSRKYGLNDTQDTYVFETALGGSLMVDLRDVSTVGLQPPTYELLYGV